MPGAASVQGDTDVTSWRILSHLASNRDSGSNIDRDIGSEQRQRQPSATGVDCEPDMITSRSFREVTIYDVPPSSNLTACRKAIEAAGEAIELVRRAPAPLKSLADQVIRSASSVPANLAEGHGRLGRDRTHHWRIAYASAKEVDCHLRILCLTGAVPRGKAATALQLFDEVRAMTWRLLHPK